LKINDILLPLTPEKIMKGKLFHLALIAEEHLAYHRDRLLLIRAGSGNLPDQYRKY
jgi:hypothetical protein